MVNIIIFGTGSTSILVQSVLKENISVICYCDNNCEKWGQIYCGKRVLQPTKIKKIQFDYIIIASQFTEPIYNQLVNDLKISEKKILRFFNFIDSFNYVNWSLSNAWYYNTDLEIISTGISYVFRAIKSEFWKKKIVNFANASQDLYSDYHMINYLIKKYKKNLTKWKYVIIGLSYYSFEYDLSLSSMKNKAVLYYEAIGVNHHLKINNDMMCKREIDKNIANKIIKLRQNGYPDVNWNKIDNKKNDLNYKLGKQQALLDGNKNYPKTVEENVQIFRDYIELLKNNNIKPIVIVCPASKYYYEFFPIELKKQFYSIINKMINNYDFQFLDYFESELFNDEDFYDVSHLNDNGAEKFAGILQKDILW